MRQDVQFQERLFERAEHAEITAARTPVRFGFAFEIFDRQIDLPARLGGSLRLNLDRSYIHGSLLLALNPSSGFRSTRN